MITEDNFLKRCKETKQTKYEGERHIRLIFDVFSKGEGVMAFCAEALIGRQTFYDWLKAHQEFKKAYDIATNIAGRKWEEMPAINPDFNFPYWSTIMRNRFGYGKAKVRIVKDATPLKRLDSIWEGLEEGELSGQEATQLSSLATAHYNILTNQPQESEQFKLETKEEIMAKVHAIQNIINHKQG